MFVIIRKQKSRSIKNKFLRFLFCILLSGNTGFAQIISKSATAYRTHESIKIDGKLDEQVWKIAAVTTGFTQFQPNPGQTASERTQVRIIYDAKAIYIGAILYDNQPDSISSILTQRDNYGMSDGFSVLFDTYNDASVAYVFGITAAGVQVDNKLFGNGAEDFNWNAVWRSKTTKNENGWVAEIEIPYSALRFTNQEIQNWKINFLREINRHRELSTWFPADPSAENLLQYMGKLKNVTQINSPLRLSVTPFVAAYAEKQPNSSAMGYSLKGGMDLKYGISESFTLDMMLIPDFGQVQSDDVYLDLSPYEIYYQENRNFFTEGTEIFNRAKIFYSRRIGGTPQNYNDVSNYKVGRLKIKNNPNDLQLINATKISGKTKNGFSIGFLNGMSKASYAVLVDTISGETQKINTQGFTNYNVTVAEKSFGNNAYVSLINTNIYIPQTDFLANVTGSEIKLVNKKNTYSLVSKGAISNVEPTKNNPIFGHYYDIKFAKISGNFRFSVANNEKSDTYNPNDMGYIQRNNEFKQTLSASYNKYKTSGHLLSWNVDLAIYNQMLYKPRVHSVAFFSSFARFTFLNQLTAGTRFSTDLSENHDYYEPRKDGYFVIMPRNLFKTFAFISSNYAKKLALDIFTSVGKTTQKGSESFYLQVSPRWQATNKLLAVLSSEIAATNAEIGYADESINQDTIFFGLRNRFSVTNTLSVEYILTNKASISIRGRHYRQTVDYLSVFMLNENGTLSASTSGFEPENINSTAFTADVVFKWEFAPGSELSLAWKNQIYTNGTIISDTYFQDFSSSINAPQINSLSVKVLYYLDYLYLKK